MKKQKRILVKDESFGLKAYLNKREKIEIVIFGRNLPADNETEFENLKQSSEGLEVELSSGEKRIFCYGTLFWLSNMAKGNTSSKKELFENFSIN